MSKVLVVGGAGYIGSHMVKILLDHNYEVEVWDNFSNSSPRNINKVKEITGKNFQVKDVDLRKNINQDSKPDCIIDFAALKAVGESVENPLKYYENNVGGTINLLKFAKDRHIKKFIFSSTAAVYGNAPTEVVNEKTPTNPESPYAWSKFMSEQIVKDAHKDFGINAVIFRYFNVTGNAENGAIGDELKAPQNLIPRMIMSHLGYLGSKLQIFGNDYPTKDGTGVRDYIHVLDLVDAHLKAIKFLGKNKGIETFNLGTGNGYSVLEIIKTFEKIIGEKFNYDIVARRPGDMAVSTTDATKAKKLLKWEAKKNLDEMISSSWLWYTKYFRMRGD